MNPSPTSWSKLPSSLNGTFAVVSQQISLLSWQALLEKSLQTQIWSSVSGRHWASRIVPDCCRSDLHALGGVEEQKGAIFYLSAHVIEHVKDDNMQFEERQIVSGQKTQFLLVSCGHSRYKPCPSGPPRTTARVTNESGNIKPQVFSVFVFICSSLGLNMQVLTLAAYCNFTAQRVFSADRRVEGSVATGGLRTSRGFSLCPAIIPRRRKVLGKDKRKLSSSFKYITPQISCLSKSEILTTKDNEIIKD